MNPRTRLNGKRNPQYIRWWRRRNPDSVWNYNHSPKGRAARKRWLLSPQGRATRRLLERGKYRRRIARLEKL